MRLASSLGTRRRLFMQLNHSTKLGSSLKRPSDQVAFTTTKSPKRPTPQMPQSNRAGPSTLPHKMPKPIYVSSPMSGRRGALRIDDSDVRDRPAILKTYASVVPGIKPAHVAEPAPVPNAVSVLHTGEPVTYNSSKVRTKNTELFRTEAIIPTETPIVGIGDGRTVVESRKNSALALICELQQRNMLYPQVEKPKDLSISLSDGSKANYDDARQFMDYYCHRFHFSQPQISYSESRGFWEALMNVEGRKIGMGIATTKKAALQQCYLDVLEYLDKCDTQLWLDYKAKAAKGTFQQQRVTMHLSNNLQARIRDLLVDVRSSELFKNRPAIAAGTIQDASTPNSGRRRNRLPHPTYIQSRSKELEERQKRYEEDPALEKMRATRHALPVHSRSEDVLAAINANDVTILMAATGSGKTTQVPQLILDSFIKEGQGAQCNILCTQPRRLAALSVAHRVANERGEKLGTSVGYVVRFEAKPPEPHGSITFCTIGVFLKMLQTEMTEGRGDLDSVTHVVVDEVHERDVDTDLLLVVLKRVLAERKARGKTLKVILMSATIDPTPFQKYFPDGNNVPAPVVEVPGRTFPVQRHYLEDFFNSVSRGPQSWIFNEDSVVKYAIRELGVHVLPPSVPLARFDVSRIQEETESEIELPYPLIASTIAHVLQNSDSGHVLTFLAGWDDITAVQKILLNPPGPLPIDFNSSKYSIHLLHSSVPLAEQQVIFDPPPPGVRRIILATNIAETSVTIPDVVYVVDSARLKEQRYDPEKHISSLVSAWVGSSNLNQRAGRAGRHRPGEYYGVLSKKHADSLQPYQTVEMSRVDLSNVVMHIKALNFPGMRVEEVLAATIEPPQPDRVAAAMKTLQMVGAIDEYQNLTSLGRVLQQIPVDVQVGRLLLMGSFFRCLDQALTLAALLTNRDPFMSPMHLKDAASAAKNKFCPPGIKSDALTALRAYNVWETMQLNREHQTANRFCVDNFLSKPTLLMVQKLKAHLLQSLYTAGVIDISAGGGLGDGSRYQIPPELNLNGDSMTLLAALIAVSSQPKFAVRSSERIWRTQTDKGTMIHPSSVNHPKQHKEGNTEVGRQIIAFSEKRRNVSAGSGATTFLVGTTRLEPLLYALFGAHKLERDEQGLLLDHWINLLGNLDTLDNIYDLRTYLDGCMTRVFEGLVMGRRKNQNLKVMPREEDTRSESGDEDNRDYSLSRTEVKELDLLSRDLVNILNQYSTERGVESVTRPGTPLTSPSTPRLGYPGSGFNTPAGYASPFSASQYNSRASTPVGRMRRL